VCVCVCVCLCVCVCVCVCVCRCVCVCVCVLIQIYTYTYIYYRVLGGKVLWEFGGGNVLSGWGEVKYHGQASEPEADRHKFSKSVLCSDVL